MKKKIYRILDISLTRACNYNCSYCNQRFDIENSMYDMSDKPRGGYNKGMRNGKEWIEGLNNFPYKDQYMELIFSGGEPSLHPDFFEIVTKVKGFRSKKMVTNLSFNVTKLIKKCKENRTCIIVQPSFHFEYADFDDFLNKIKLLDSNGFLSQIRPVTMVDLPDRPELIKIRDKFEKNGYIVSVYEFEGYYKGNFCYADINGFGAKGETKNVICCCACNCVLPNGDVLFCPTDTYLENSIRYGNICNKEYREVHIRRPCSRYGKCHISSASWIEVETADFKKRIWKGDNFLKINMIGYVIKALLRPLFKNKCFNIRKYIKYIKLHLYSH